MGSSKHDRQIRMFGEAGQARLRQVTAAVCGLGGLGSHVVQQLAFLGIGGLMLIDDDVLDVTNRNRLVGVRTTDPDGMPKTAIAARLARETDEDIAVDVLGEAVEHESLSGALDSANWIFGCFDNDAARLTLLQHTAPLGVPLVDLATDVLRDSAEVVYGGRIVTSVPGRDGCLLCTGEIDQEEVRRFSESPAERKDRETIYGVQNAHLGEAGPSVVCLNGVIASLAVMEFMVAVTELREPVLKLEYRGKQGTVHRESAPIERGCYFCAERTRRANGTPTGRD